MNEQESLHEMLIMARRALYLLEEQASGYTALTIPANLVIEIAKRRKEVAALKARINNAESGSKPITYDRQKPIDSLERARQVLQILEMQASGYTALTIPAHLHFELEEKRREVNRLERLLAENEAVVFPDTLPVRDGIFVGREKEIAYALDALSPENRAWGLIIDGIGGIGKTALAVEVAYLCQTKGRFEVFLFVTAKQTQFDPNNTYTLDNNAAVLGTMLDMFACALDATEVLKAHGLEKTRAMLEALHHFCGPERRTLLVLDNLETLSYEDQQNAMNFLRRLPDHCKAIVTSRHQITGEGAGRLHLGGFNWETAQTFIVKENRRAGQVQILSEAEEKRWRELYNATDGSPLALRWSLGLMRTRQFSLDRMLHLLQVGDPDSDLFTFIFQEVKSKITTTDWQVLGGLASFENPLDFGNLLTITELSTFELEAALERLSVYSLVNTMGSSGPYSIYPLTRRFVLNELSSSLDGMRFISRNTFYVNVGRFLEQAGFVVRPMVDRLMYRCDNIPDAMRRLLPKSVYVHVTQSEVNANNILEIRREVQKIEPNAQVVLLVTDHSPTDQGWAQIGTLSMAGFKILPIERTLVQSGIESKHAYSLLLTEIEKRLGKDYDPYDVRDPVAGAFSFFGRDPFIEDVLRRSIERHPVGIFGLRKLGKSSVIQALRDRVSFPVALVNLQLTGQAALEKVCKRILKQWSQWMQVHYDLDWQPPPLKIDQPMIGFIDAIANLLQSLESQKGPVRVGLFLDEIELLIPSAGDNQKLVRYLTFMRTLRGLVDEDDHFSFIVASLNPSVNRINAWNDEQNPTFNLFQEIYLPPLANDDCIQMIRNIGQQVRLSYSVDTLQIIVDLSGGHPFLARQFCSLLYKQRDRQPGEIKADAIAAAIEHFIYDEQTVTHLDAGIWQDAGNQTLWGAEQAPVNQAILLDIARANEPLSKETLLDTSESDSRRTALINLERYHFIHQPEPGYYALRFGLLRTWLRRRKLGLKE